MLDAHQLNIFLVAAELESFSQAARQLNLSQPSVSAQIKSLERLLRTQLFHRAGRHISLSEEGQILLPLAREMVRHSIHIEETMASLGRGIVGHLKLGCSTAVGKYTLPRLIARFRAPRPAAPRQPGLVQPKFWPPDHWPMWCAITQDYHSGISVWTQECIP